MFVKITYLKLKVLHIKWPSLIHCSSQSWRDGTVITILRTLLSSRKPVRDRKKHSGKRKGVYLKVCFFFFLMLQRVSSNEICLICFTENYASDVYWTVHNCDNWRIKNQLNATCYFIVLLIGSTCFRHYYAHHQELMTMMLITTLVISFLVYCMLEVRCS